MNNMSKPDKSSDIVKYYRAVCFLCLYDLESCLFKVPALIFEIQMWKWFIHVYVPVPLHASKLFSNNFYSLNCIPFKIVICVLTGAVPDSINIMLLFNLDTICCQFLELHRDINSFHHFALP